MKALLIGLFLIICSSVSTNAQLKDPGILNYTDTRLLIDRVIAVLNKEYVNPAKADLYKKKLNVLFKNGAFQKSQTKEELANRIWAELQKIHKDLHLKVRYYPEAASSLEIFNRDSVIKAERPLRLIIAQEKNFGFIKKEILPGNIGYIRWDSFDEFVEEGLQVFDSAFKYVTSTKTLIIDMRYNRGGNVEMVNALENYFFTQRTALNHFITRTNDTLKRYTEPGKTNFKIRMPVYVLSSRQSVSGAEDFIYTMQQNGRAKIIGDYTAGGAHSVALFSLGQRFVMAVPTRRVYNEKSKTDWEGKGITPDVYCESESALPNVLQLIYTEQLSKTNNEADKKIFLKQLVDIKKGKYLGLPFQKEKNTDAPTAIVIKDSIYGPTNVGVGCGAEREYREKTPFLNKGAHIFVNEENSAWFKISLDHDTLLSFDLVPTDPANDFDFVIFKCEGAACLEQIKTFKVKVVRECHSGFASYNGATGLSAYATASIVGIGPGPTYVNAIPVKAGEVYYLMVNYTDNYIREEKLPHGFTLYFHNYWPKKKATKLKTVTFNSNSNILLQESFAELNKLVALLKKEKAMAIEITGYADARGDNEKNLELSKGRAEAVKNYLVSNGINVKRIYCKGLGSSHAFASNSTEQGRKQNRRVEFSMIMK